MKMITAEGWRLDGYRTRPEAATRAPAGANLRRQHIGRYGPGRQRKALT